MRSFCLITAGGAPLEILKKYIRQQGEKNIQIFKYRLYPNQEQKEQKLKLSQRKFTAARNILKRAEGLGTSLQGAVPIGAV